jgi:hypothetical protein
VPVRMAVTAGVGRFARHVCVASIHACQFRFSSCLLERISDRLAVLIRCIICQQRVCSSLADWSKTLSPSPCRSRASSVKLGRQARSTSLASQFPTLATFLYPGSALLVRPRPDSTAEHRRLVLPVVICFSKRPMLLFLSNERIAVLYGHMRVFLEAFPSCSHNSLPKKIFTYQARSM